MTAQTTGKSFARRLGVEENADYDERKLMILREAARCFVEKGVHKTSIDEIATNLNVTKPTIYHYVGSKDGIIRECLAEGSKGLDVYLGALDQQGLNGMERLVDLFRNYTHWITDDFSRCLITIDVNALKPESRGDYAVARRRFINLIRDLITQGMKDGSIKSVDPTLSAMAVIGAFNFIANWYRADGPHSPDEIADAFLDFTINGLKP